MKLVNLVPLEELDINDPALMKYRASRTADKSDSPISKPSKPTRDLTYAKKLKLDMLKAKRDQLMRDMEQEAEPEGGPIADRYGAQLNKIDAAMAKLRGTKDMTYNQAIGLRETTEKAWNAIDVSRKAEKAISNKEWNERTAKKLDMLKKLNDAGKFKKDFDDERLQGWIDQNYSWQKLSKQFKLNEVYSEMYSEDSEPDTRFKIDGKPVDLDSIEMGGLDNMRKYGPDDGGPDAYIESAYFLDGAELTDVQKDEFMDKYPDKTYETALEQYLQEGKVCESCGQMHEGSCGYTHTTDGSKLRTPGGTKGMSADKRTMTMMREAIRKEIKKLYGNK